MVLEIFYSFAVIISSIITHIELGITKDTIPWIQDDVFEIETRSH